MEDTAAMPMSEEPSVVRLEHDDEIWVEKTDKGELLKLLANPYEWVKTKIAKGKEGWLADHFVITFEEMDPTEGHEILIHGIKGTGLITVQVAKARLLRIDATLFEPFAPSFGQNFSEAQNTVAEPKVKVATLGTRSYAHLELPPNPSQVADIIYKAALRPGHLCDHLNGREQCEVKLDKTGHPCEPANKKRKFKPKPKPHRSEMSDEERTIADEGGVRFLYEGERDDFAGGDPPTINACNVDLGDEKPGEREGETSVEVHTVIVKAYAAPEDDGNLKIGRQIGG